MARHGTARDGQEPLRRHLLWLLGGGDAHDDLGQILAGLPPAWRGVGPPGVPYTMWRLLEHMRLAQWDILDFSRNPDYRGLEYPDEYWPRSPVPPSGRAWGQSIRRFQADLEEMRRMVGEPKNDLYRPIPHGQGQTLLREALLVADHNSYHLGQMMALRQWLDARAGMARSA